MKHDISRELIHLLGDYILFFEQIKSYNFEHSRSSAEQKPLLDWLKSLSSLNRASICTIVDAAFVKIVLLMLKRSCNDSRARSQFEIDEFRFLSRENDNRTRGKKVPHQHLREFIQRKMVNTSHGDQYTALHSPEYHRACRKLTKALRIFNTSKSCDTISLSVESVEDFEDFISMMMDISYGKFLSKPIAKGSENIEWLDYRGYFSLPVLIITEIEKKIWIEWQTKKRNLSYDLPTYGVLSKMHLASEWVAVTTGDFKIFFTQIMKQVSSKLVESHGVDMTLDQLTQSLNNLKYFLQSLRKNDSSKLPQFAESIFSCSVEDAVQCPIVGVLKLILAEFLQTHSASLLSRKLTVSTVELAIPSKRNVKKRAKHKKMKQKRQEAESRKFWQGIFTSVLLELQTFAKSKRDEAKHIVKDVLRTIIDQTCQLLPPTNQKSRIKKKNKRKNLVPKAIGVLNDGVSKTYRDRTFSPIAETTSPILSSRFYRVEEAFKINKNMLPNYSLPFKVDSGGDYKTSERNDRLSDENWCFDSQDIPFDSKADPNWQFSDWTLDTTNEHSTFVNFRHQESCLPHFNDSENIPQNWSNLSQSCQIKDPAYISNSHIIQHHGPPEDKKRDTNKIELSLKKIDLCFGLYDTPFDPQYQLDPNKRFDWKEYPNRYWYSKTTTTKESKTGYPPIKKCSISSANDTETYGAVNENDLAVAINRLERKLYERTKSFEDITVNLSNEVSKLHETVTLLQDRFQGLEGELKEAKRKVAEMNKQNLSNSSCGLPLSFPNGSCIFHSFGGNSPQHVSSNGLEQQEYSTNLATLVGYKSKLHWDICEYVSLLQAETDRRLSTHLSAQRLCTSAVQALWPRAQVRAYGSFVTRLSLPSSDLDLVICLPKVRRDAPADAAGALEGRNAIKETWQQNLARKLRQEHWVIEDTVKTIPHATIPIITLMTKPPYNVRLDISFEGPGHNGLATNDVVATLIHEFPQLVPMMLVLKTFVIEKGFAAAYSGGLSSYALFLMVTRFLQEFVDQKRHEAYSCQNKRNATSNQIDVASMEDLGALLLGFLDFYGNKFDPRTIGISVASNTFLNREQYNHHYVSQIHQNGDWHHVSAQPLNSSSLSSPGSKRYGSRVSLHEWPLNTLVDDVTQFHDPHRFDPVFIEDPLRPSNNVGRNCFRITPIRRAFSEAFSTLSCTSFSPVCRRFTSPIAVELGLNPGNLLWFILGDENSAQIKSDPIRFSRERTPLNLPYVTEKQAPRDPRMVKIRRALSECGNISNDFEVGTRTDHFEAECVFGASRNFHPPLDAQSEDRTCVRSTKWLDDFALDDSSSMERLSTRDDSELKLQSVKSRM